MTVCASTQIEANSNAFKWINDSLYFGLAAKNLREAVTDNLRGEFIEKLEGRCGHIHIADAKTFFPRTCRADILFDCSISMKRVTLLKAIQSGELFGMEEVDIRVPTDWCSRHASP